LRAARGANRYNRRKMTEMDRFHPVRWLGAVLVGVVSTVLGFATGASRVTIDRLAAEAGLPASEPWRRLTWLLRSARRLIAGWVRRAAGRAFDRRGGLGSCDGLVFAVPHELTTLETRGEFFLRRYEAVERRFARRYVTPDATVLELGGCLGVVACVVNRRLADCRRHIVFEPHPAIAGYLEQNRERNGCSFAVRRQIVAAQGPAVFYLRDPFVGGSSLLRPDGRGIAVPTVTIPELEVETGLSFDTLIVDIEGGEHGFFAENTQLLSRARLVIVEFHPQIIGEAACAESRDRLRAAGLTPRAVCRSVETWTRPTYTAAAGFARRGPG
jgi:FkbM family methyltransferase